MARKKAQTPEEIVAKLRQVEVLAAQAEGGGRGRPGYRGDRTHVLQLGEGPGVLPRAVAEDARHRKPAVVVHDEREQCHRRALRLSTRRTRWPSALRRRRCGCGLSRPRAAIVCLAWTALLTSYRKLNRAKFAVLTEIEADLPVALFTREREAYRRGQRRSLSDIERLSRAASPCSTPS
jgi:hypothetical protein